MLKRLEVGAGIARMWFVRIPRSEVPTEGVIEWLDERWLELDRAVGEHLAQAESAEGKDK
jgi:hypothetical protein